MYVVTTVGRPITNEANVDFYHEHSNMYLKHRGDYGINPRVCVCVSKKYFIQIEVGSHHLSDEIVV